MSVITYQNLALDWQPLERSARDFHRIVAIVFIFAIPLMVFLTIIKVPEQAKRERALVPDRIAEFIARKEKPIVEPPKPIIKPLPKPPVEKKPEPIPEPTSTSEPLIEKVQARKAEQKPLTESQKAARKVAEKSGLLALSNELNDLVDTTAVQAKIGKNLANGNGTGQEGVAAGHDTGALTSGIAQTGGSVDQAQYASKVGNTELDTRKVEKVALADIEKSSKGNAASKSKSGSAGEDVSLVFDKNKSSLYSLYERERRSTPDLQGKIVFQLTISPTGEVVDVKIISSDLHNPELEARLLSRIKAFKFKAGGEKPTTITYPVEFLPS